MAQLKKQHMTIHWKAIVQDDSSIPATEATLKEKATLVGRIGLMMLSVGTGAWRVRNSMNKVSRCLGITCTADIGLLAISYTCIEGTDTYTQSISLPTTGVNTHKLMELELFMKEFPDKVSTCSAGECCGQCCCFLSGLCPYHSSGTKSVVCIGSPSGWLHLCDAVCHSGISADYGRYRPCKTRFAVRARACFLRSSHHPNSNHDWLGNGCHLSIPAGRL